MKGWCEKLLVYYAHKSLKWGSVDGQMEGYIVLWPNHVNHMFYCLDLK